MPAGSKPIEALRPGDLVLASPDGDPTRGVELKRIVETYANPPARLVNVHVGEQVIRATLHHPFYVRDRGWTGASALRRGDLLLSDDGSWRPVREIFDNGDIEPVYNLHVEDHRTYFVGEENWGFSVLVHNQSGAPSEVAPASEKDAPLRFAEGTGPVKIVGILGSRENPSNGEPGGIPGTPSSGLTEEVDSLEKAMRRRPGNEVLKSDIYGSSAGQALPPDEAISQKSTSAEDIAQKLFAEISKAFFDGKFGPDKDFRLLIMGTSWGGDKAIDVAKILHGLLVSNADLANAGFNIWMVRVYLITEDAVPQNKRELPDDTIGRNVPKRESPDIFYKQGDDVTDWLNLYERQPDTISIWGLSYPESEGGTANNRKMSGPEHLFFAGNRDVKRAVREWLGLPIDAQ